MKTIEYYEFGNRREWLTPTWACLSAPDPNLRKYYEAVLNSPFDKKRFRRPGVFRTIGAVDDIATFSNFQGIRCLDMPIKMAGSSEYRVPAEFLPFLDVISQMVAFENAHNPAAADFHAYLTIDQSNCGGREHHRAPGLHVDGFQGARINPKVACDRSYIVCDCDAPSFWNQAFETVEGMDDGAQNIFHEFDRTKHYSAEIPCQPGYIYFMDSYAVHSANPAKHTKRTFCRLSFSARQFDRLGNSHNNCFDYEWAMTRRDVATSLS